MNRRRAELQQLLLGLDGVRLAPGVDAEVAATLLLTCVATLAMEHEASPDSTPPAAMEALLAHVLSGLLA